MKKFLQSLLLFSPSVLDDNFWLVCVRITLALDHVKRVHNFVWVHDPIFTLAVLKAFLKQVHLRPSLFEQQVDRLGSLPA